jgi:hypothetical protein
MVSASTPAEEDVIAGCSMANWRISGMYSSGYFGAFLVGEASIPAYLYHRGIVRTMNVRDKLWRL